MDAVPAATARRPHQGVLRGGSPITVGTPSLLRAINERTVLDLIHRQGPLSRAQVARVSGLSKPTVSLALTGLLEADLVREVGRSRGERGPSALLYELNPMAGWAARGSAQPVGRDRGPTSASKTTSTSRRSLSAPMVSAATCTTSSSCRSERGSAWP